MKLYYKYLLTNPYKMGSIQGIYSGEHWIDSTGTNHGDSDLQIERINVKNDSLRYSYIESKKWFH